MQVNATPGKFDMAIAIGDVTDAFVAGFTGAGILGGIALPPRQALVAAVLSGIGSALAMARREYQVWKMQRLALRGVITATIERAD